MIFLFKLVHVWVPCWFFRGVHPFASVQDEVGIESISKDCSNKVWVPSIPTPFEVPFLGYIECGFWGGASQESEPKH